MGPDLLGLRRGLIRASAATEITRATNAEHLAAHGKPIWGIGYCTIEGNTTLPKPVPVAEQAKASKRLALKYELTTERGGIKMVSQAKAYANPLCQEELPVLRAEACHEGAQDD